MLAAVPPRGLRGGLGLALAAGLSLGGLSRALSLCGWPARCLLGVGIDALLAQPELHGCLAASAEQQEELELPSSRPLRRARSRRAEAILQSKTDNSIDCPPLTVTKAAEGPSREAGLSAHVSAYICAPHVHEEARPALAGC